MAIKEVKLILDESVRNLCFNSYPLHPKGCPNFGKKKTCPPHAPLIQNVIDINQPVYAIWNVFDFGSHVKKMKSLHPNWSKRQLECCLYWQGTARKNLKEEVFLAQMILDEDYLYTQCPEAMGVNVTKTMRSIGEILEWPPVTKTYQVSIAGMLL